ncbi:hypothetical protein X564_14445 [Pseudoalteromonas agarivorans]|nr:hypothetical protein X564_14445 [Pseudoalteromonas agarivorans]
MCKLSTPLWRVFYFIYFLKRDYQFLQDKVST